MMSVSTCSAAMASSYYEQDDRNYYSDGEQADVTAKWHGHGLERDGLREGREVTPEKFQDLLQSSGNGCAGYDVTFSAPKSVSIAAEAGDTALARDMMDAHRAAVASTLKHLEANEVGYITRQGGVDYWIQTGEADVAEFVHGVSRGGDPQLHSHCVFLNRTHDSDGKQRTIDGRHFFASQKSYGAEYRMNLARELQKRGYEIVVTDEKQGFFELKGMEPATLERFSKRRQEILAELERTGETGAKAAQQANLSTRKTKKHIDQEQAREAWRQELAEIGQDIPHSTGKPIEPPDGKQAAYDAAVADLEQGSFAFTQKQLTEAVVQRGVAAGGISVDEARRMIADDANLLQGEKADGKTGDTWLTTRRNLETDKAIEDSYLASRGKLKNSITAAQANSYLNAAEAGQKYKLNGEQRNAASAVLSSKSNQQCIQGLAGVGKTFMVSRVVDAAAEYNKTAAPNDQIHFVGLAPSGKAASGLLEESGSQEGGTIHSYLNKLTGCKPQPGEPIKSTWDFSNVPKAKGREIVFVDEAGLMDNNLIRELQKMREARSGPNGQVQLVYLGDYSQLPPVGAAQPFKHLTDLDAASGKDGNTVFMTNIQRQKDQELLAAVNESVKGDHLLTFEALQKKGDYREIHGEKHRRKAIAREMTDGVKLEDYGKNLLIVGTNRDRKAYNDLIRSTYVKRGELEEGREYDVTMQDGDKERTEKRRFAKGERVIFGANSRKLDVMNGQMGTITAIDGKNFTIRKDDGKTVTVNLDKYNSIDQAWSITNYKAQGMSVNGKVVCDMSTASKQQYRNDLYVDVSRAKNRAIVFTNDKALLEKQTGKWAQKVQRGDFSSFTQNGKEKERKKKDRGGLGTGRTGRGDRSVPIVTKAASGAMKGAGEAMKFAGQMMEGLGKIASIIPIIGKPIEAATKIPAGMMKGAGKATKGIGNKMDGLGRAEKMMANFSKDLMNTVKKGKKGLEKADEKMNKDVQMSHGSTAGPNLPDTNKWDYTHGGKLMSEPAKADREMDKFFRETLGSGKTKDDFEF